MPLQAVYLIGGDGVPTDYRYILRRADGKIVHECCCAPKPGYIYSSINPQALGDHCHDEPRDWEQGSPDIDAFTVTVGGSYTCSSPSSQHSIPPHTGLRFYPPRDWAELDIGSLGTIFTATLYIRQVKPAYGYSECLVCGGAFDYGADPCGNSGLGSYVFTEGKDESNNYYIELTSDGYLFSAQCNATEAHPHVFEERIRLELL